MDVRTGTSPLEALEAPTTMSYRYYVMRGATFVAFLVTVALLALS